MPFSVLTDEQFYMYHYSDNVNYETSNIKITPPKNLQSLFKNFNELSSEENSEDDFSINCKYYDIDSFHKAKFNSDKHLSVLHINIASLSKHKQDLETFLAMLNFEFSIIAITETKIKKVHTPLSILIYIIIILFILQQNPRQEVLFFIFLKNTKQ